MLETSLYYYFAKYQREGLWQDVLDALREKVRLKAGRKPNPSVAILDSQSVKTSFLGGQRGYDAAKHIKGRKRHILVDTLGMLLAVVVHRADIDERRGATFVFNRLHRRFGDYPFLKRFYADAGYAGEFEVWVRKTFKLLGWMLEIIKKPLGIKFFRPLPKRWIVATVERKGALPGFLLIDDAQWIMNEKSKPVRLLFR